ncbi:MAG: hypothetical protein LGB62_07720, partial [Sulfurovum sp.]|nr:hypothetical protein [Sulfurovum sp.]
NMSTLKALKEYLVGAGGYLLNDDNNGKTVMLSGAWGSGKTHFWQNEIEEDLTKELKEKNKACVYVSLYGKDNIEVIKSEILQKAYSGVKKENTKQTKAISAFGMGTKILAGISIFGIKVDAQDISNETKNYYDEKKIEEATDFLSDGGLICFDDFERKSKKIDLNDLFGFISQLAIDMNCKIVIILNSDVFEGEEANVFKTVKEKTVNKFFYFEPELKELFESIYTSENKYQELDTYKVEILKAIIETKELNARIYIQVLDNCLEWLKQYNYNQYELRAMVLITTNFLKNHFVFSYKTLHMDGNPKLYTVLEKYYKDEGLFEISNYFIKIVPKSMTDEEFEAYFNGERTIAPVGTSCGCEEFLHQMHSSISKKEEDSNGKYKSDSYYEKLDKTFHENKDIFYALNFYAYVLQVENRIDKDRFDEINQFVKTGILPKAESLS